MTRPEIIAQLLNSKGMFEAQGVVHVALFGSQARGDSKFDSDLDLLLDVPANSKFSILELVYIEEMIEKQTGFPTNAFLKRSLNADFKATIAPDLVSVF